MLLATSVICFSCSKDKIAENLAEKLGEDLEEQIGEDEEEQVVDKSADLLGVWQATELMIDANTASDEAKFGKQILDFLTEKECYIITFEFNSDLSVTATNSVDYLEINVGGSGLDIPCPTEEDTDEGTFAFDGEVLTYTDSNNETLELDVVVDGDVMTIDATQLDVPNFNASGELVFERVL